jgi:hypothetical protein
MSAAHLAKRPAAIAAEIYQFYVARPQIAQMLVEGFDDRRFYGKFVDHTSCRLDFAGNKENALDVLRRLNQLRSQGRSLNGYLVIVDADFDHILAKKCEDPNLIYTDAHSAECMFFRDSDWKALLVEFGLVPQSAPNDFLAKIEKQAQKIGLLRMASEKHRLYLNFKDLGREIDGLFDAEAVHIDFQSLIEVVLRLSHPTMEKAQNFKEYFKQLPPVSRWHAVSGHDLMDLLASYLRQKTDDQRITEDRVAAVLRVRYDSTHFKQTRTYVDIRLWEEKNPGFIVFALEAFARNEPL